MKHVPNGRDERKTARGRTQGPVKRTVLDGTGPMKEKSIINSREVEKFVSRSAVVRWCEQWGRMRLRIRCELSRWKSSC